MNTITYFDNQISERIYDALEANKNQILIKNEYEVENDSIGYTEFGSYGASISEADYIEGVATIYIPASFPCSLLTLGMYLKDNPYPLDTIVQEKITDFKINTRDMEFDIEGKQEIDGVNYLVASCSYQAAKG